MTYRAVAVPPIDYGRMFLQGIQTYKGIRDIERQDAQDVRTEKIDALALAAQADPQKMGQYAALDPKGAYGMQQRQDYAKQQEREEKERVDKSQAIFSAMIQNKSPEQQIPMIEKRIQEIDQRGGDSKDTRELLQMVKADPNEANIGIDNLVRQGELRGYLTAPGGQRQLRFSDPFPVRKDGKLAYYQTDPTTGETTEMVGYTPVGKDTGDKGQKYGQPFQAMVGKEKVFLQRDLNTGKVYKQDTQGRYAQVANYKPVPRSGRTIELTPGGGFRMTEGGEAVMAPTKPTVTSIQKKIADNMIVLSDLELTSESFDKDFLTYGERAKNWTLTQMEKFGFEQSPEVQEKLQKYYAFRSNATGAVSAYMKSMSGVAINPEEIKRIEKTFPTADDSYSQYKGKMGAVMKKLKLRNRILRDLIREGKTDNTVGEINKRIAGIQSGRLKVPSPKLREQDLIDTGMDDEQIYQTLYREGYI